MRILHLRLGVLPDPFSWLVYLSNRLTMLTLTRCLLVDVYLFVGRLAIQTYNEEAEEGSIPSELGEMEKTVEDFDSLEPSEPDVTDIQILEIRNRLVGFPSMLISSPGLEDWKKAVGRAANLIAVKYFPEAEHPLEEAAIGPLLTRSQAWINPCAGPKKCPW